MSTGDVVSSYDLSQEDWSVRESMKTVIEASEQKTLENLVKAKDNIVIKHAEDKISE
jgi:hypothetical protein